MDIKDGEFREESPFTTRYAFTNNALPIRKRNHYAMINLFGPEVHFAASDRLNVGIMTTWIGSPLIAVGKYTIPTNNEKVNFSIGTMLGTSGYLNQFRGFGGLHWGTFTYGDRSNNISFSAGYGYFEGGGSNSLVPGEYVGDSSVYTSSNGTTTTDYYYPYNIPIERRGNMFSAPIFSLAGIVQITSRASLFFDSMLAFGKRQVRATQQSSIGGVDAPYVVTITEGPPVTDKFMALYIMPGMRFQVNNNFAFQFSVAGVSAWQNDDVYSFPLPLASMLFKF